MALPATSILILPAKAQNIELAKNKATAASSIFLRPHISESLAHIGPAAALARRYAPPIHEEPRAEWREADIVGMAVVTMV